VAEESRSKRRDRDGQGDRADGYRAGMTFAIALSDVEWELVAGGPLRAGSPPERRPNGQIDSP
jgi:hypothetical protein